MLRGLMSTGPHAFRVLVAGFLASLVSAQQSQPTPGSQPERVIFPKLEFSVVPPAGWKVDKKSDGKGGDSDDHLMTCTGDATGPKGIWLRILKRSRTSDVDARWLADAHARGRTPKSKILEAKDLRYGGEAASLFLCEDQTDVAGKSAAMCTLVCVVKGEDNAIEFHVNGPKEDVVRHRPLLDQCFASTRLGAWAVPGTKIKHPWHPLTLLPPEGWRVSEGSTGSVWTLAPVGEDKQRPSLTVTTLDGQKDFGVSKLKSLVEAAQKKTFKDFKATTATEVKVAGRKAALIQGKFKSDDKPMVQLCWFAVGDPRAYILALNCKESELASVQAAVEACIASIEIAPEGKR
jgi:hypothetical protein